MVERIVADICVIGAGSGGLAVAAVASQLGVETVLIEGGKMGGDCLNYGCVPSKSLLAAGHAAAGARQAAGFGVNSAPPDVDFGAVSRHVHDVIAAIAPNDSVERFEGLGVRVIRDWARFVNVREVAAGPYRVTARRFVIATGSSPLAPPIPGLEEVDYLTNETIFDNNVRPEHLIVIGGGPIGMELAQAYRRLGANVTVLELFKSLGKDDPELAGVVVDALRAEGVAIEEGVRIESVRRERDRVAVDVGANGDRRSLVGSHLLVATGRKANVDRLDLAAAGIEHDKTGILVDRRLRTTNRRIYAIGDVAGGLQFTHVASYHAGIVIRNALFRFPARVRASAIPRVTYTDPELAQVGVDEETARRAAGRPERIKILRWPFAENDRATAERTTAGFAKVIVNRRGRILGAGIVGAHAGELIQPWVLALEQGLKIGAMANMIVPYPTLGEVGKRAAGTFFVPTLFSPRTQSIVRFLARLG